MKVSTACSGVSKVGISASLRISTPSATSSPPIHTANTGRAWPCTSGARARATPVGSVMAWGERMITSPESSGAFMASLHRLEVALRRGVAQDVHRVGAAPVGRQEFIQLCQGLGPQDRGFGVPAGQGVHRHDPGAAGVGDDAQGPAGGPLHLAQGLGAVEELAHGFHPDDAGPAEGGVVGLVGPDQGPGVGGRGPGPGLAAAGLDDDDGLDPGDGAGRAHELAVLGQALHVDDDAAGLLFVAQVIDEVGEVHVRHGADADEVAEADVLQGGPAQDGAAQGAALGDEGQVPGGGT